MALSSFLFSQAHLGLTPPCKHEFASLAGGQNSELGWAGQLVTEQRPLLMGHVTQWSPLAPGLDAHGLTLRLEASASGL